MQIELFIRHKYFVELRILEYRDVNKDKFQNSRPRTNIPARVL